MFAPRSGFACKEAASQTASIVRYAECYGGFRFEELVADFIKVPLAPPWSQPRITCCGLVHAPDLITHQGDDGLVYFIQVKAFALQRKAM